MDDNELNKNYSFLFERSEDKEKEINNEIKKLMDLYPDMEELKNILNKKYGEEFFEYTYINDLICYLNSEQNLNMKDEILYVLETMPIVKQIYIGDNNTYRIELVENEQLNFTDINTLINELIKKKNLSEKIFDNIYLKEYLEEAKDINQRNRQCHIMSINLAKILTRFFDINCNVVTGYPKYYINQQKFLHSWIELEVDGKTYVIDSTMNTTINKQGYYLLKHIDRSEILSIIKGKDVLNDYRQYGDLLYDMDLKTYLSSRDEIINDLEKNKSLFNKTDEGEER